MSKHNAQRWEEQFGALCGYLEQHGHCNVPATGTGANGEWKSLGSWVRRQRKTYAKFRVQGNVNKDLKYRFEKLKGIGFKFIIGKGNGKKKVAV